MTAVESRGTCSLGEECTEYKNLAFLLMSLGITIILVGALFYYVKQRFEVLEVLHKEQIGVMRNFTPGPLLSLSLSPSQKIETFYSFYI